jgi:hypothetical protein
MTVSILLPPDTEAKLRQRAAEAGKDVAEFVSQLIAREVDAPLSIAEAAEPFARAVDASGISEGEFTSLISQALDESRGHRKTHSE